MKSKRDSRKRLDPIDVRNQELMIKEGLHPPHAFKRDPSVWSKTDKERTKLQIAKARYSGTSGIWTR